MPNNYRQISLTCIPCSLLESFIKGYLINFLSSKNLLFKHQYGLFKEKSTTLQLTKQAESYSKEMTIQTNIIYIDFSKAFDKVSHYKLIFKMMNKGIQ